MAQSSITPLLLEAKRAKGVTFEALGEKLGCGEVWVAGLFYGQATASPEQIATLAETLDLPSADLQILSVYPVKGSLGETVPVDPLVYRFYEIVQIYGLPLKDVIQEKFGDGIMSAIDFSMKVEKEENPAGDRVVLTMNGKFLPYRKW